MAYCELKAPQLFGLPQRGHAMPAACRAAASAARQASSEAEALLERRIRQSLHHQPHVMLLASNGANITGTAPCCKAGRLVDRRESISWRAAATAMECSRA